MQFRIARRLELDPTSFGLQAGATAKQVPASNVAPTNNFLLVFMIAPFRFTILFSRKSKQRTRPDRWPRTIVSGEITKVFRFSGLASQRCNEERVTARRHVTRYRLYAKRGMHNPFLRNVTCGSINAEPDGELLEIHLGSSDIRRN